MYVLCRTPWRTNFFVPSLKLCPIKYRTTMKQFLYNDCKANVQLRKFYKSTSHIYEVRKAAITWYAKNLGPACSIPVLCRSTVKKQLGLYELIISKDYQKYVRFNKTQNFIFFLTHHFFCSLNLSNYSFVFNMTNYPKTSQEVMPAILYLLK